MSERDWTVPVRVDDIPETGRQYALAADAATRVSVARAAGVDGVARLEAQFDVTRQGKGLHVVGAVSARVRQKCVVTLEPIDSEIEEKIDLVFLPGRADAGRAAGLSLDGADPPELLVDGAVDLGALATEFLILAVDPYPRKPGVVFTAPADGDVGSSPFAALAALKKGGAQ